MTTPPPLSPAEREALARYAYALRYALADQQAGRIPVAQPCALLPVDWGERRGRKTERQEK